MKKFNFGANLRQLRSRMNFTQEGLGDAMKVSQTIYSKVERGVRLPDQEFIERAAKCLEVSVEELTPEGWDQYRKAKIGAHLTPLGKIAYRLMLAMAFLDMGLGFGDAVEIPSPFKLALVILFEVGAFFFWKHTEKPVNAHNS